MPINTKMLITVPTMCHLVGNHTLEEYDEVWIDIAMHEGAYYEVEEVLDMIDQAMFKRAELEANVLSKTLSWLILPMSGLYMYGVVAYPIEYYERCCRDIRGATYNLLSELPNYEPDLKQVIDKAEFHLPVETTSVTSHLILAEELTHLCHTRATSLKKFPHYQAAHHLVREHLDSLQRE